MKHTRLPGHGLRSYGLLALALLASPGPLLAAEEDTPPPTSWEYALVRQAPKIIRALREDKYQNVGVLKFGIKVGKASYSDNLGTLNQRMADQLERALILANDDEKALGIIKNASAVAAAAPGANHLNEAGRKKLFQLHYPLAWGQQKVKADALLYGLVEINTRMDRMEVELALIDGKTMEVVLLGKPLPVSVNLRVLEGTNQSYVRLRDAFGSGKVKFKPAEDKKPEEKPVEKPKPPEEKPVAKPSLAEKVAEATNYAAELPLQPAKPHPIAKSPVRLEILYNGVAQKVTTAGGKALVPEPQEDQTMTIRISLRDPHDPATYGVVVKVNGVNTIEKQKADALSCRKWIINQDQKVMLIDAFWVNDQARDKFQVLPPAASRTAALYYGEHAGTIQMVVFRAVTKAPPSDLPEGDPPKLAKEDADNISILRKGSHPVEQSGSLDELKKAMKKEAKQITLKGMVEGGIRLKDIQLERVRFTADPVPVALVGVIYYQRPVQPTAATKE